jgi:hypothetical protein
MMMVVEQAVSKEVLGSLKVASKLGVTADEWERLWEDVPQSQEPKP